MSLKKKTCIFQTILVIVIGAAISGIVGGVTSQIHKWDTPKSAEVVQVQNETVLKTVIVFDRVLKTGCIEEEITGNVIKKRAGKIFVA
jgi:hypothetical protein